jgi:hypothetical protein
LEQQQQQQQDDVVNDDRKLILHVAAVQSVLAAEVQSVALKRRQPVKVYVCEQWLESNSG